MSISASSMGNSDAKCDSCIRRTGSKPQHPARLKARQFGDCRRDRSYSPIETKDSRLSRFASESTDGLIGAIGRLEETRATIAGAVQLAYGCGGNHDGTAAQLVRS